MILIRAFHMLVEDDRHNPKWGYAPLRPSVSCSLLAALKLEARDVLPRRCPLPCSVWPLDDPQSDIRQELLESKIVLTVRSCWNGSPFALVREEAAALVKSVPAALVEKKVTVGVTWRNMIALVVRRKAVAAAAVRNAIVQKMLRNVIAGVVVSRAPAVALAVV